MLLLLLQIQIQTSVGCDVVGAMYKQYHNQLHFYPLHIACNMNHCKVTKIAVIYVRGETLMMCKKTCSYN